MSPRPAPHVAAPTLNDYANSMFRFERLHNRWVENCTAYVRHLFGDKLRDAVVLDYAFGRGNWSVAFKRAGARRVIAIDASEDNVERFAQYCSSQGLDGIEVIHGNFLQGTTPMGVDIVWAYGILPHVWDVDEFVGKLAACLGSRDALLYVYAYNVGSLRNVIVNTARDAIPVMTESAFRDLSLLFTPAARIRMRDDLTAPHVHWYNAEDLGRILRANELYILRQDQDFPAFLEGVSEYPEFSPYQFLCGRNAAAAISVHDHVNPLRTDANALENMSKALLAHYSGQSNLLEKFATGLLNTHFSALNRRDARKAVIEDYLYLLYCLQCAQLPFGRLDDSTGRLVEMGLTALGGALQPSVLRMADGVIAHHLAHHSIRL